MNKHIILLLQQLGSQEVYVKSKRQYKTWGLRITPLMHVTS